MIRPHMIVTPFERWGAKLSSARAKVQTHSSWRARMLCGAESNQRTAAVGVLVHDSFRRGGPPFPVALWLKRTLIGPEPNTILRSPRPNV